MQFSENGPDIPAELIKDNLNGNVVFICGSGMSKVANADFPTFKELVEAVYSKLGVNLDDDHAERVAFNNGEYDRTLRCLEKRTVPAGANTSRVRESVEKILNDNTTFQLQHHKNLLLLSLYREDRPRILTTNFDTLFEKAWNENRGCQTASPFCQGMPKHATPEFYGVFHLHGRIQDQQLDLDRTNLILSSSDFGDAYLRDGWATRYIYDLLRRYSVVLIGYSADDPPMRYLLEAVDADRSRFPDLKEVYSFSGCSNGEESNTTAIWKAKGCTAICYTILDDFNHSALYHSLHGWAEYKENPSKFMADTLSDIFSKNPDEINGYENNRLKYLMKQLGAEQIFNDINPDIRWMARLQDMGLIGRGST